jgi:SAM-dependent methyltransferase
LRKDTIGVLRDVNRRFYRERACEFSRSRERPWSGWGEFLEHAEALLPEHPRVLDVGCGNGRFARFLEDRLGRSFDYCGVDESPLALAEARKRVPARESRTFVEADFLEGPLPPLPEGAFDLIVLFGVLHHVPGRENRIGLLTRLSKRLAPSGLLGFSVWRFALYHRFQRKIVRWDEFRERTGIDVDVEDLEPGDHILTWGGAPPAFRYCHAMGEEEEGEIEAALALDRVATFDAGAEPNRYSLFRCCHSVALACSR